MQLLAPEDSSACSVPQFFLSNLQNENMNSLIKNENMTSMAKAAMKCTGLATLSSCSKPATIHVASLFR